MLASVRCFPQGGLAAGRWVSAAVWLPIRPLRSCSARVSAGQPLGVSTVRVACFVKGGARSAVVDERLGSGPKPLMFSCSPSRGRTGTSFRTKDFKSSASAFPPRGQRFMTLACRSRLRHGGRLPPRLRSRQASPTASAGRRRSLGERGAWPRRRGTLGKPGGGAQARDAMAKSGVFGERPGYVSRIARGHEARLSLSLGTSRVGRDRSSARSTH